MVLVQQACGLKFHAMSSATVDVEIVLVVFFSSSSIKLAKEVQEVDQISAMQARVRCH